MADKHIILGAGGHAKVLLEILRQTKADIAGVCDPALASEHVIEWRGLKVLGADEAVLQWDPQSTILVNAIGQLPRKSGRFELYRQWQSRGYRFATLVHPSCVHAQDAILEEGVQLMAGAILQPDVHIGVNTVINTGAKIDHDCRIGAHVHIAPGAVLCGGVVLSDHVFVGAGAVIVPGVHIGPGAIIGANTTVRHDLPEKCIFTGQTRNEVDR